MTEFKEYAPGTFCWVDLATTDADAAKAFYTKLFGWTATDVPAGEAGTYTMLEKDGKNVCALYQMNASMMQKSPPHWLSYISVPDIAKRTSQVKALGGAVLQEPCDVMQAGRMSLVQDPTGAIFALWEPKEHIGAQLANEPSTLSWNELHTTDVERATQFYTHLFDWTTETDKSPTGVDYISFQRGDRGMGGMMAIQPEWGEVVPNWVVYFAVENCDATLNQAKLLGGKIEMAPMEIEDVGRFAILKDPQGAYFTVIQLKEAASE